MVSSECTRKARERDEPADGIQAHKMKVELIT